MARRWSWGARVLIGFWVIAGCKLSEPRATSRVDTASGTAPRSERSAQCPARAKATQLPHAHAEQNHVEYWLARSVDADKPLLSEDAILHLDRALRNDARGAARSVDLTRGLSRADVLAELDKSLQHFRARVASGEYVVEGSVDTSALDLRPEQSFTEDRSLRVALRPIPIRCTPLPTALRSTKDNPNFDRNSCSSVRAQEAVELLGRLGTHVVARSRYAFGFIVAEEDALSPAVPPQFEANLRKGRELEVTRDFALADGTRLQKGTILPAGDAGQALVATRQSYGVAHELPANAVRPTLRPLTRRTFLEEAIRYLGSPYGWGDQDGGRDCSRLVLDILRSFGLRMPRVSDAQSESGSYSIEVPADASEVERLGLLDAAHARGIVLLYFPGHIMIYLGRDAEGVPRVLHSFAEYLVPCPEGGETLFEVGRVGITDLSLGKDTTRRSFLERITRLTVFGDDAGPELLAFARFRVAAPPGADPETCTDSTDAAIFRSPREPLAGAPLRVIAALTHDPRPHTLFLRSDSGTVVSPTIEMLGTGPFSLVATVPSLPVGRWTTLVADGESVIACERFNVSARSRPSTPRLPKTPVWEDRWRWERDTEHLYAAFVEYLFSTDIEDLKSWSSLTELLADPKRNLLFNHLGLHEDERLKLTPDCADLPYFLRAYFSWKLALPFAFRPCTRGRAGEPPRCTALHGNDTESDAPDEVAAFAAFARKDLGYGVHSGSARTTPQDEATDLYPTALSPSALAPGAVFADPYGHTIIVAKWVPQGLHGQGILLGADAQPDGTVGKRRFWPGNFLFTPDTKEVGAGFKAFRTLVRDEKTHALRALSNDELKDPKTLRPFALDQYQADARAFYERMDALIYPRPVALDDRIEQLVSALWEQVVRRVEAIDVGEKALNGKDAISMPTGADIFETTGAWEDFATPSRDMRLLIAVDTVRALPDLVAREPSRFGMKADVHLREVAEQKLQQRLTARTFEYTRSDGSTTPLRLTDVIARVDALEVGYNPNDCPEVRWGAPKDSQEASTCKKRAPQRQQALMSQYRAWFHTRTRPPRE